MERAKEVLELIHSDVCGPLVKWLGVDTPTSSPLPMIILVLEAMKSEIDSMSENLVWDLVDHPEGIVPIENKWVFKIKIDVDGKVETYKARLVAKGYRQRQRVDYEETFSPIAMLKSIRIMLAIGAHYNYEVWQMYVKTAFLNGYTEEDIFHELTQGF
ncbi:hypothetical protein CRG98_014359 [Punica granatum]|uniref:Reverse transcriptase Ty1/copia-type domain-containing protein n=1 Tax=Punica granatum TaxID=22663 RepID=A0A2I0KAK3_PUNGR|nr:hypothetical protein CRG98_014359 [Punica granatum]